MRGRSHTTRSQGNPHLAFDANGGFVVAWNVAGDGSDLGVFARRFDAAGVPLELEFPVNT